MLNYLDEDTSYETIDNLTIRSTVTTILYSVFPALLVIISFYVWLHARKKKFKDSIMFLFFSLALLSNSSGEFVWMYIEYVLEEDPFPSVADLLYVMFYPFLIVFLLYNLKNDKNRISPEVLAFGGAMALLIMIPTFLATYDWNETESEIGLLVALSYPAFSAIIFGLAITGLLFVFTKKSSYFWNLILSGIIIFVFADVIFLNAEIDESYYDGHPVDWIYLVAYIVWIFGLIHFNKQLKNNLKNFEVTKDISKKIRYSSVVKMAIPMTLAAIITVTSFSMYQLGLFGFLNLDDEHVVCEICFLIIGILVAFSTVVIVLYRNLAFLVNLRKKELEEDAVEEIKTQKLSSIGELSSRLAHDLRNPLSVIKNSVFVLEHNIETKDEKTLQYLEMLKQEVERMNHQINEVLGFIKTREIKISQVLVTDLFKDSIPEILPKNISIKISGKDTFVNVDKELMLVALRNLIQNSIQAIDKKEGVITLTSEENDEFSIINVKDNGQGIPIEILDRIFEPLYTTKQEGTGLGLVSCKTIIEQHGGTIAVKNNLDSGVTFTIKIPKSN